MMVGYIRAAVVVLSPLQIGFMRPEPSVAAQAKPEKATVRIGYASPPARPPPNCGSPRKKTISALKVLTPRSCLRLGPSAGDDRRRAGFCRYRLPRAFPSQAPGFDLRVVGDFAPVNVYLIASRKEITDPKQLKGKRVGVNQFLDTSHVSARFALRHVGVDPDSVTFIQVGSTPERFAALRAGTVDGAVQAALFKPLLQQGLNNLISLYDMKIPDCSGGFATGAETLKEVSAVRRVDLTRRRARPRVSRQRAGRINPKLLCRAT